MRPRACATRVGISSTGTLHERDATFLSPATCADLEKRLLPSTQFVLRQDRELTSVPIVGVVVVVDMVTIVHVELQEFAVVCLQIPVELGILLGEFGKLQHVRGTLIYMVQSLSKKDRQKVPSKMRTFELVDRCERRTVVVVVVHVDVGIFIFRVQTLTIRFFDLKRVHYVSVLRRYPSEAHVCILLHETCPQEVIY